MEEARLRFTLTMNTKDFKTSPPKHVGYECIKTENNGNKVILYYIELIDLTINRIYRNYYAYLKNLHEKRINDFRHEISYFHFQRELRIKIKRQRREKNERRRLINEKRKLKKLGLI
jgi:hypothetical protein